MDLKRDSCAYFARPTPADRGSSRFLERSGERNAEERRKGRLEGREMEDNW